MSRKASISRSPARPGRSAVEMVKECFRHQHPEEYGGDAIPEPAIPTTLRHGPDLPLAPSAAETLPEPMMGHPDARSL
jgi:hypothetical protein